MVEKIDTHVLRISNQDRSVPPNERSTGNFSVSFPNERFSMTNKILHVERVTYFNTIPTIYDSSRTTSCGCRTTEETPGKKNT